MKEIAALPISVSDEPSEDPSGERPGARPGASSTAETTDGRADLRPDTMRLSIESHRYCPGCSSEMFDRGCKLRCPRCGFFLDCSDG